MFISMLYVGIVYTITAIGLVWIVVLYHKVTIIEY